MAELIERYTHEHDTQLVQRADGEHIEGYAIVFYDPSNPGTEYPLGGNRVERVLPESVDEILRSGEPVQCRFNHSEHYILDENVTLVKTRKGVAFDLRYDAQDPQHQTVRAKLNKRQIKGSSFKALCESKWVREGEKVVRYITRFLSLQEVSPCYRPAYKATSCFMRAEDETEIEKSYQDWQEYEQRKAETEKRIEKLNSLSQ